MIIILLLIVFADKKTLPQFKPAFKLVISAVLIGITFKILHWKLANEILLFSFSVTAVLFVAQFILRKDKSLEEFVKTIFVCALTMGSLYSILHWSGSDYFDIVALVCGVIFMVIQLIKYIKRNKNKAIPPSGNENNL